MESNQEGRLLIRVNPEKMERERKSKWARQRACPDKQSTAVQKSFCRLSVYTCAHTSKKVLTPAEDNSLTTLWKWQTPYTHNTPNKMMAWRLWDLPQHSSSASPQPRSPRYSYFTLWIERPAYQSTWHGRQELVEPKPQEKTWKIHQGRKLVAAASHRFSWSSHAI